MRILLCCTLLCSALVVTAADRPSDDEIRAKTMAPLVARATENGLQLNWIVPNPPPSDGIKITYSCTNQQPVYGAGDHAVEYIHGNDVTHCFIKAERLAQISQGQKVYIRAIAVHAGAHDDPSKHLGYSTVAVVSATHDGKVVVHDAVTEEQARAWAKKLGIIGRRPEGERGPRGWRKPGGERGPGGWRKPEHDGEGNGDDDWAKGGWEQAKPKGPVYPQAPKADQAPVGDRVAQRIAELKKQAKQDDAKQPDKASPLEPPAELSDPELSDDEQAMLEDLYALEQRRQELEQQLLELEAER